MCTVDGCSTKVIARGWCFKHYARWRRSGDPAATKYATPEMSVEERLRNHGWTVTEAGCWEWGVGYGSLQVLGASVPVHRAAFETWVRALEPDEVVRHRCDNPPCINPDHLIPGTHGDNARDRVARARDARTTTPYEIVFEMREVHHMEGMTYKALGARYGVSATQAWKLVNRRVLTPLVASARLTPVHNERRI
jgi:hypothetical protein